MNEYNGVLTDNRPEEVKNNDYKFDSPEFATAIALNWVEKDPSQWKRYTTRNQDGSGSCVAQGFSKALETLNIKEVYSATPIFKRRQNFGTTGMYLYDAADIVKKLGTTLESLCNSQNINDAQIDATILPETPKKISGYIYANNKDFYAIAGMVEQYGHCIVTFGSNYDEWKSIPIVSGDVKWGHCVCVVDYVLYNGKQYLVIEDSWGHGATDFDDRRLISAEFVQARCTGAVSILPVKEIIIPAFKFESKLKFGMKNNDVTMLQKALQKLGFFPSGTATTGYYGVVTMQAVNKFQLAYKDEILAPYNLTTPTGIFGTGCIKKLNELLNNTINMNQTNTQINTVETQPTKKWYMSKTLWIGLLTSLTGALIVLKDSVPNPEVAGGIVSALGILNIAIRFLTTTELN